MSEEKLEKSKVRPIVDCNECEFSVWGMGADAKTQIGCEFNRLPTFEFNGHTPELTKRKDGRKAFIIDGAICNRAVKETAMKGIHKENRKAAVIEFTKARVSVIIYANASNGIEDVFDTLNALLNDPDTEENPPKTIIVMIDTIDFPRSSVGSFLQKKMLNLKWHVLQVDDLGYEDAVDEAFRYVDSTYFTVVNAGEELPPGFVRNIDYMVNEELKTFNILVDDEGVPLLYLTKLFKDLGGNYEMPYFDKHKAIYAQNDLDPRILPYYD